jgi:hypothetical protein
MAFYWAGERPADFDAQELRPWPPPSGDRRRIDEEYEAAAAVARDEDTARRRHEQAREDWLATHAPGQVGQGPLHECLLFESEQDDFGIEFEELAPGATLCGARRQRAEANCLGSAETVIAGTAAANGRTPGCRPCVPHWRVSASGPCDVRDSRWSPSRGSSFTRPRPQIASPSAATVSVGGA